MSQTLEQARDVLDSQKAIKTRKLAKRLALQESNFNIIIVLEEYGESLSNVYNNLILQVVIPSP